jgi:MFS family permease
MFIVAMVCGMLGYGVMALAMTATPLAMHHFAHPFAETSFVIQWHVLGMFGPAFVTGHLIKRYGVLNIMLAGVLLGAACMGVNLTGSSVWHFWTALLFLGISWNFLFIGATTLLTETYRPEERAKTQALNDFAVFTTVALSSLSAGALQSRYGWQTVNLGLIPLLLLIFAALIWGKHKRGTGATL